MRPWERCHEWYERPAKLQRGREVLEQQRRISMRAVGRELRLSGDELDELSGSFRGTRFPTRADVS